MSQPPKVSVCLPVYNGEKFLSEAITSVLNQSFTDLELLIADDCSTDSSRQIIERFAASDERIRIVNNDTNLGLFQNYNKCIEESAGTFIKLFAQDDVFHPDILARMVEILENKPEISLVSCTKGWISETGERIEPDNENALRTLKPFDVDTVCSAKKAVLDSFQRFVNWLGEPSTVMFRNEHKGYGYDVRFRQIGDLEYSYRLLKHGDYYFISDELCKFRKHAGSTTNSNGRSISALLDWFVLGSKYRELIAELNETEDQFCERLTRRLIKTISTRFSQHNQLDSGKVLQQLTDYADVLSCFAIAPGTTRDLEAEYKVFAVCALREGANLHNEIRYMQSSVELQERQIADLKAEMDGVRSAFESELKELRSSLSELGNSASWKVTAPLRSFKKMLR